MAASFTLKTGDVGAAHTTTLLDRDGAPVNLAGATVSFHLRNAAGTTVVDENATVIDAAAGQVCYTRTAGDGTHTAGRYTAEYEVTYASGDIQTFPEDGYLNVVILDDLA